MSITSSSMLVELNISVWGAEKVDKKATDDLTFNANAARDAARVHKNLMSGTSLRKDIADFAAGCRLWHNTRTLAWSDRGPRLLPTSLFMEYKSEANARRDRFHELVDTFLGEYEHKLVPKAMEHLGDLFNADDYPTISQLRDKFSFKMVFSPVPESGDFRIDVGNRELEQIKAEYDEALNTRVAEAMRGPWDQLHKMLEGMSEKLVEKEGTRRWHDSFIGNAQELCAMLTHLNVTNDPELEKARRELEKALVNVDIDDIKEDENVRASLKKNVDDILGKFDW